MNVDRAPRSLLVLTAASLLAVVVIFVLLLPPGRASQATALFPLAIGLVVALTVAYLAWNVEPAWIFSAAIVLTPFAGNWQQLGIPGPASPDRLLFLLGALAVLLRAPGIRNRPTIEWSWVHLLLGVATVYALASAAFAGTLSNTGSALKIVDAFGIVPFAIFITAPLAFQTVAQRRVLLGSLVGLAAYLSFTVFFETLRLDALVFPHYIVDDSYGIHVGRGRGPFVDAVANGLALFTGAVACGIAYSTWSRQRWRWFAVVIGLMCMVGVLMTLERSVWIGAVLGSVIALLAARGTRRYVVPLAVASAVAAFAALTFIPGLSTNVDDRANESGTINDRQNLARAAINMIQERPLFGWGWDTFQDVSADFFEQANDYPLSATGGNIHNTPLTYAADLGLIGLTLWGLTVLFGVGGALASRGPPELMPWRLGLIAVATALLVVLNSVPPTAWPNRSLWLLAAVVYSGRYWRPERSAAESTQPVPRTVNRASATP